MKVNVRVTKRWIKRFQKSLDETYRIGKKTHLPIGLLKIYRDAIKSQIADLKAQLKEKK